MPAAIRQQDSFVPCCSCHFEARLYRARHLLLWRNSRFLIDESVRNANEEKSIP
jgi:hypothetical protein